MARLLLFLALGASSAWAATVTIKPVQDTGLEGTPGYINYAAWGSFYTGHLHGTPNDAGLDYIYLKYDLSVLTPPAHYAVTINSVTFLGVTISRTGVAAYQDGLYAVEDTSWTDDNITWANKPALGSLLAAWDFPPTNWSQFTATSGALTDYVASKFATPGKLVAFSVFGINPPANSDAHGYNDSVNIYSPDFALQLRVDYTLVPESTVATPVINPGGGSSWTPQVVTITCGTSGAVIHYTRNGADPDNASDVYTAPFTVGLTETVKARAYGDGYSPSAVATAIFSCPTTVATPVINPSGGSLTSPQTVTITCNTPGATIRYTLTGADPDTTGMVYASALTVSGATTVKARAYGDGYDPSAVATAIFFPANQAAEIDPAKAPVVIPSPGSLITPISHQPYFLGERELFGYRPRFIPNTVTFDADNRPYMCVGMYANGHDLYGDEVSLGVVQTLDNAGNWIQLDTFIPAIKKQYPAWNGLFSAGTSLDQRIVFDSAGDAYMLVQTYWQLGFNLLLHSKDKCRTWQVFQLPSTCFFFKLEVPEAWNDTNRPPVLLCYPYGFPGNNGYTGGPIYLIAPTKFANGKLNPASTTTLITVTTDSTAYPQPNQSGMGNSTISKGNLVHVVFMRCAAYPGFTGTPQYVVTYNRSTGAVTSPVFLGCSDSDAPQDHDGPVITIDSQGYLHAVLGSLHATFKYTKSLAPNSSTSGWTAPISIGRPKNGGGWTYISLVCDKNDTLHIVGNYAGYYYCFGLWYIRKTAAGPWEDLGPLVMPFRPYYSNWYQRLTMDGRGRLFLNYMYYGDQYDCGSTTTHEIDAYRANWPWENPVLVEPVNKFYSGLSGHDPAMIMSDDGGTSWRIALTTSMQVHFTNTFENGLDGWSLTTGSGTTPIQAVSSYTYNGKTITPRTGATFARSETSPEYKKATRTLDPAQYGAFTGYLNMVENVNVGMLEIHTPNHVFAIMANAVPGMVAYLIDNALTSTTIPVITQAWHQVKFVAGPGGLDGYWDGTLLFHSPYAEKVALMAFGTEWSSAPCGYDDFSFTPASTVQGQVTLLNFTGSKTGLPVSFELRPPGQTTPLETDNATLDASGNYSFATALAGTYDLTAKAAHWLRQKQTGVALTSGGVTSANFTLTNGDCDGSNAVNAADSAVVLSAMDSTSGGSADLDGDGTVTSTDLAVVLGSMDITGD